MYRQTKSSSSLYRSDGRIGEGVGKENGMREETEEKGKGGREYQWYRILIIILWWAGVQPTLDPYAEAFMAGPLC